MIKLLYLKQNSLWLALFISMTMAGLSYGVDPYDTAIDHNKQGLEYAKLGLYDYAVAEFKLAIMISPSTELSANYYNNLGTSYLAMGQNDEALDSFQYALKLNPLYGLYYENIVRAYAAKGNLSHAEQVYEEIVQYNDQDAEAYLILALIYNHNGNFQAFIDCLKKVKSLSSKNRLGKIAEDYLNVAQVN